MNVLKLKQLKLPSSFSGMKKAVSITNLTDNFTLYVDGTSSNNLTLDSRLTKSKSPSIITQEIMESLNRLSSLINDKSNKMSGENFIGDDLPASLSTQWLFNKYNVDFNKQMQQKTSATIELLSTELNYLIQMQFLLDISTKIFPEIQSKFFSFILKEDVFLNLADIYEVNYLFWSKYLYPSYENAKKENELISIKCWKEGFKEMASLFFPYQGYCSKMIHCQKYIQTLEKENKHFAQFSQWFSHLDQANRESLTDFIAKPFQRLTKYKLLLSTISKFSNDSEEQKDIEEMIDAVNSFLKQVELKISIAQISMRIDPIEIVEPPTEDLLDFCMAYRNFDLTSPIFSGNGEVIREIKKDGVFKFKEAQNKAFEVSCLLFTDLILICQKIKNPETDRIKIIRPIISIKKLDMFNPLPGALVIRIIDDFGCLSAMYLLTNEPGVVNDWIEAIQTTKILLKDIHPLNYIETKMCLKPQLNVISSSPVPTDSVNSSLTAIIPKRSSSPNTRSLNRSQVSYNISFNRSNFRSSPVIRKRMNSVAKSTHLSLSEDRSPLEVVTINRSLSQQHSSRSHLSILEDEFDQLHNLNFASSDVQSSNLSIRSESGEDLKTTASETQNNDNPNSEDEAFQLNNIKGMINHNSSCKLSDNRLYKSMVDLNIDS